uniref:C-type lectin domain-containing protein n=1 Tax=Denticeps clupeoides TaxID=299321 RepID=A0AAY4AVF3_9TELE
ISGAEHGEGFRRYSWAAVCLGLLGLVLLGVAAGLCIKYRTERDQILERYTGLHEDLLTNYSSFEKQKKQFQELNGLIFISATKDVWNASRNYCREKGGDLVVINSREKQVVINKMGLNGWIGLSDESEDKTWRWVDGTTLTAKYWDKGQPNNMNEDCVVFHSKKDNTLLTWHDYPCSSKQLAICELVSRA